MHITRYPKSIRLCVDCAPPATPAGVPSCLFGVVGNPLPHASLQRLSATKRNVNISAELDAAGGGDSARVSSPAPAWGAAIASKARKANDAAGLQPQRLQQQGERNLETVEAVAVASGGSVDGSRGAAATAAAGGPVVVVQPQEPSQRLSASLSSPSPSAPADGRRTPGARPAASQQAPPAVTFMRPTGHSAAGGASPSWPQTSRTAQKGESGASSRGGGGSSSGASARSFTSYDPFTNARISMQTDARVAAPPAWLAAAAVKRPGGGAPATADGTPPPPPRFSAAPPRRIYASTSADAKSRPRAVDPAVAAATAAAAAPTSTSTRNGGEGGDLPLSVSFSQVMGRGKRIKGDSQEQAAGQNPDPEDSNVVDYTWEPDPDLDVIEADAAAEAEERRREQELRRDVAQERREWLEAAEVAVQRSYAPGALPPPAFVGSVKADRIPGRGFGLVAEEDLAAGQLLLVSLPALCEKGPAGRLPKMRPLLSEALRLLRLADGIPSLDNSRPPPAAAAAAGPTTSLSADRHRREQIDPDAAAAADGRALASLYWGTPRPSSARPPADLAEWRRQQQERLTTPSAVAAAAVARDRRGGAAVAGSSSRGVWTQPRVMSLLQLNLVAEGTQDGAAAVARCEPLASVTGVWPEVGLINHSCAPNAVAVLLPHDQLVVRATRCIPRGREVLLNWLSSGGALAPVKERRTNLSEMYKFFCRCARCQLESGEYVSLPFLYSDAERDSEEALEAIEQALEVRDLELLTSALPPLQEAVAQLANAVQLLGEQVDLTAGREGMLMAAAAGGGLGDGDAEEGGADGAAAAGGRLAAAAQRVMTAPLTRKKAATAAPGSRLGKSRGGVGGGTAAGGQASSSELGPQDRATAEAWLIGGMLPLHEALVDALAYRTAWLGMDLGPGWHWPREQPVVVPATAAASRPAAAAAAVVVDDEELEEQQAEAMAELIGSLASYVDVVGQLLPGSETHTQAAARLLSLSRRFLGPMDRVARDISTAVYDAHVLRYGKMDEENFERLLAAGIEALDAARRRAADVATEEGDGDDGDGDGGELEAGELELLFLEDRRLREAHAEAAAAAAAATTAAAAAAGRAAMAGQPPQSWPLPRWQAGNPAHRVPTAALVAAAAPEDEQEEEEQNGFIELPEGVAEARPVRSGGSGGGGRHRGVMKNAEQDLMRILAGSAAAASGASRSVTTAAAAAAAAAARAEEEGKQEDEAAAIRRLFRRDTGPRVGGSAGGPYLDGDDEDEDAAGRLEPGVTAAGKGPRRVSPQKKFDSSLDTLLNVFPGLNSTDEDNRDGGVAAVSRSKR